MAGLLGGARFRATRRSVNLLRAGAIGLAVIGGTGLTLATGIANADPAPAPRFREGNTTTCAAAGLSGSILFGSSTSNPAAGSGTVSADGRFVDVTINEGWTASGVVVKGGDDTYIYDGPFVGEKTIEDMRSPLNNGGQIPEISHWFVCGMETPPTTPPATTEPPATTPPATTEPPATTPPATTPPATTEPPATTPPATTPPPHTTPPATTPPATTPPATTEPPTVPPTTPTDTQPPASPPPSPTLPTTGTRTGLMIGSAVAMIGSGLLLIAFVRQRRRFEA